MGNFFKTVSNGGRDCYDDPVCMVDSHTDLESMFGNTYAFITKAQIEELLNGSIIYSECGEYCIFIKLKEEQENE